MLTFPAKTGSKIRRIAIRNLYLLDYYRNFPDTANFFLKTLYFDKLAGSDQLRKQIIAGKSEAEIRESWQADLVVFKAVRKKYLLYGDFE